MVDLLQDAATELFSLGGELLDKLAGAIDFQELFTSLEAMVPAEAARGMQEFWPLLLVLLLIFAVVELFELPLKLIWNGLIGAGTLFVVNILGAFVGFNLKITLWKALVAGFLGIPGTIAVIIYEIFGNK